MSVLDGAKSVSNRSVIGQHGLANFLACISKIANGGRRKGIEFGNFICQQNFTGKKIMIKLQTREGKGTLSIFYKAT